MHFAIIYDIHKNEDGTIDTSVYKKIDDAIESKYTTSLRISDSTWLAG